MDIFETALEKYADKITNESPITFREGHPLRDFAENIESNSAEKLRFAEIESPSPIIDIKGGNTIRISKSLLHALKPDELHALVMLKIIQDSLKFSQTIETACHAAIPSMISTGLIFSHKKLMDGLDVNLRMNAAEKEVDRQIDSMPYNSPERKKRTDFINKIRAEEEAQDKQTRRNYLISALGVFVGANLGTHNIIAERKLAFTKDEIEKADELESLKTALTKIDAFCKESQLDTMETYPYLFKYIRQIELEQTSRKAASSKTR